MTHVCFRQISSIGSSTIEVPIETELPCSSLENNVKTPETTRTELFPPKKRALTESYSPVGALPQELATPLKKVSELLDTARNRPNDAQQHFADRVACFLRTLSQTECIDAEMHIMTYMQSVIHKKQSQ